MKIITLAAMLLVSSCQTVPAPTDSEKLYRKDMELRIDGVKAHNKGIYILERRGLYHIEARFYKKSERFKARSCHREWNWDGTGSRHKFEYEPDELEQEALCDLDLGSFDEKGQHSWGYVSFIDHEDLVAELSCNGERQLFEGVSVCQARTGLLQRISFSEPTEVFFPERCPEPETEDEKVYTWPIARSKCVYLFQKDEQLHRLITFGYDDIMWRK